MRPRFASIAVAIDRCVDAAAIERCVDVAENPVAIPPHIAAQCAPPSSPLSDAAPSVSQSIAIARVLARRGQRLLSQDVDGRRVEIIELAASYGPDERT